MRRLLVLLLLLAAPPAGAQTPTFVNLFRIANGGFTPIPNDPVPVGTRVFYRFTIVDVNGVTVPPGNGNFTIFSDGVRIGGPFAWPTSTLTFPQDLAAGQHAISMDFVPNNASYSGNATTVFQSWGPAGGPQTATQLSSTANPSQFGQDYAILARVVGLPGNPVTGGTVNFTIDGVPFARNPVAVSAGGQAILSASDVPGTIGRHTFNATYNPDAAHTGGGSTANTLFQTVGQTSSQLALTSSSNPSAAGANVTFTATVTAGALGNPGGTVTFALDGTDQPPSNLTGRQATFTTALTSGLHSITARYSGTSNVGASNASLSQSVDMVQELPTTTLTSSADPAVFGQPVTLKATVSGSGPSPTGTVQFNFSGGNLGAPVTLVNGTATVEVPPANLTVGSHQATFTYSGDTLYAAGNTAVLAGEQVVIPGTSETLVTSGANPVQAGQSVTYTATVLAEAPATGTPTGSVTFTVNGSAQSPVPLVGGQASIVVSAPGGASSFPVSVAYRGSGEYGASTASLTQNVNTPVVTPTPVYLFTVDLLESPVEVSPGTTGRFRFTVRNNGNQDDRYRLSVSGHAGAAVPTSEVLVPAGGSVDDFVTLTVPAGANPEPVRLVLTARTERLPGVVSSTDLQTRISSLATFTLRLHAGWNGVGFETGMLATLAADPLVLAMARYGDGVYEILPFEALSVDETTEGFWVFSQSATTVTYTGGLVADGNLALHAGWNLVAFPDEGPGRVLPNPDVLAQLIEIQPDNTYRTVEGTVLPGRAYWVFARASTTLHYER